MNTSKRPVRTAICLIVSLTLLLSIFTNINEVKLTNQKRKTLSPDNMILLRSQQINGKFIEGTRAHNWNIQTLDAVGNVGQDCSLALDSNYYPHISYLDYTNHDLKYAYFDGNEWNIDTIGNSGGDNTLALDSNDYPHICHTLGSGTSHVEYTYYNGNEWNTTYVASNVKTPNHCSSDLDSNDRPHIAYKYSPTDDLKYIYFNGNSWVDVTVDSQGSVGGWNSISMDSYDRPHISYYDTTNEDLRYAYHDGITWHKLTIDSSGSVGKVSSITLDSNDRPYISYYDYTNYDLKLAYFNGSAWNITVVDSDGQVGMDTSIVLDSNERPHITYRDDTNWDLKYAYYNGKDWYNETVDSIGFVGYDTSLALDNNDIPHISYYDNTNKDLKYARLIDRRPNANAGSDLVIDQHQEAMFIGSASTDDFSIASYNWSFIYNGTKINLTGINSTFTFHDAGMYEVTLNVTDTRKNWDTDTMILTVRDITPPEAMATASSTLINQFQTVNFSAISCFDNVGIINYKWSFFYGGIQKTFNTMNFSFTFDIVGEYVVTLDVSDVKANWDRDDVVISVNDITAPIADAGSDIEINQHKSVTFNGSSSTDNIEIVSFIWSFSYDGNEYVNENSIFNFTFHTTGIYIVSLNVSDAMGYWDTDNITVNVRDTTPPIANAGSNISINQGESIMFDGSDSKDNTYITNYNWIFTYDGTPVTFDGMKVNYTFTIAGEYNVLLQVFDAEGNVGTANITVTVNDITPPIAVAEHIGTVNLGTVVLMDGSDSTDNVGLINYTWSFGYNATEIELYNATSSFSFDIPGEYNIALTVMDLAGNRNKTNISIIVLDSEIPKANFTGKTQNIKVGETVNFDGGGSGDNVGIVKWDWYVSGPAGNIDRSGVRMNFTFPENGLYEITLSVSDKQGNSASVTRTVIVDPEDEDVPEDGEISNNASWLSVIGVGLVVVILIVGLVLFFLLRSRNKYSKKDGGDDKKGADEVTDTEIGDKKEDGITVGVNPEEGAVLVENDGLNVSADLIETDVDLFSVESDIKDSESSLSEGISGPPCSQCNELSQYYPEHDCYWCDGCQDYVSPEEESADGIEIEITESAEGSTKEEVDLGIVEIDISSLKLDGSTDVIPERGVRVSSSDLESSRKVDGN